ncbi:uncharacterized protein MONOS_10490 [Monocercomonoides exilis]|uniref:uncharacterized protein n=1 Tax=Monocercomonoides exilis TaxID=2049356 RepID=UPI00355A86EC|nr:hypothetical protein MONOS_10490 [Monocercomonoides exilis]|eukprot:MONOS_10490.1-p1 / transcript=MONOS_10490.1 / gene=MONOS_10490 / organism=Monocercomonoides_exilis_PA203 / gene_product=unspecified product / transcript_product=unspecified product / location=Mono_scaffold00479:16780-23022(-) / protein_length=2081 / sequence_SO=supercontig / SO=protein_coding / is_pseudo=false
MVFIKECSSCIFSFTKPIPSNEDIDNKVCSFSNIASNSAFGGCIYLGCVTSVAFNGINFFDCSAQKGGAIYVSSTVNQCELISASFSSCKAEELGGAIYLESIKINENEVKICLRNSKFQDCTSLQKGGCCFIQRSISFVECEFLRGKAPKGAHLCAEFTEQDGSVMHIEGCSFVGLKSVKQISTSIEDFPEFLCEIKKKISDDQVLGSLVDISSAKCLVIKNSDTSAKKTEFRDTYGTKTSGGLLLEGVESIQINGIKMENVVGNNGGAMSINDKRKSILIEDSSFIECSASTGNGGGICFLSSFDSIETEEKSPILNDDADNFLTLRKCRFVQCRSLNGNGGCLWANGIVLLECCTFSGGVAQRGCAMSVINTVATKKIDVKIFGCTFEGDGKETQMSSSLVFVSGLNNLIVKEFSQATISNCPMGPKEFELALKDFHNISTDEPARVASSFRNHFSLSPCGGLWIENVKSVSLSSTVFEHLRGEKGCCLFVEDDGQLAILTEEIKMRACSFKGNVANVPLSLLDTSCGSLVKICSGSNLKISNECSFMQHITIIDGGGLYVDGPRTLNIDKCTFSSLSANQGGGIYVGQKAVDITISNSKLTECSIAAFSEMKQDERLQANPCSQFPSESSFGNHDKRGGGGIAIMNVESAVLAKNAQLNIKNVNFTRCNAQSGAGGGLLLWRYATLTECSFDGGKADEALSAYICPLDAEQDLSVALLGCSFSGNRLLINQLKENECIKDDLSPTSLVIVRGASKLEINSATSLSASAGKSTSFISHFSSGVAAGLQCEDVNEVKIINSKFSSLGGLKASCLFIGSSENGKANVDRGLTKNGKSVLISQSYFDGTTATKDNVRFGPLIQITQMEKVTINEKSEFKKHRCEMKYGGALSFDQVNEVEVISSTITGIMGINGAGIYIGSFVTNVKLSSLTIDSCSVSSPTSVNESKELYKHSDQNETLKNSLIDQLDDNTSRGGAIFIEKSSEVCDRVACEKISIKNCKAIKGEGGGVWCKRSITISNCQILSSVAKRGAAVWIASEKNDDLSYDCEIISSSFSGTTIPSSLTNSVNQCSESTDDGPLLYFSNLKKLQITGFNELDKYCQISNCATLTNGAGVCVNDVSYVSISCTKFSSLSASEGAAIWIGPNVTTVIIEQGSVTDCSVTNCGTENGGCGGGVFISKSSDETHSLSSRIKTMNFERCICMPNEKSRLTSTVYEKVGIYTTGKETNTKSEGGGIWAARSLDCISNTFSHCEADVGCAIAVRGNGADKKEKVEISGGSFVGNLENEENEFNECDLSNLQIRKNSAQNMREPNSRMVGEFVFVDSIMGLSIHSKDVNDVVEPTVFKKHSSNTPCGGIHTENLGYISLHSITFSAVHGKMGGCIFVHSEDSSNHINTREASDEFDSTQKNEPEQHKSTLTVCGCSFSGRLSSDDVEPEQTGSFIYIDGAQQATFGMIKTTSTSFKAHLTSQNCGVINIRNTDKLEMSNVIVDDVKAESGGVLCGGASIESSSFSDCSFSSCSAQKYGGAFAFLSNLNSDNLSTKVVSFEKCTFSDCISQEGGAIYLETEIIDKLDWQSINVKIENCTFRNNFAYAHGGAISYVYLKSNNELVFRDAFDDFLASRSDASTYKFLHNINISVFLNNACHAQNQISLNGNGKFMSPLSTHNSHISAAKNNSTSDFSHWIDSACGGSVSVSMKNQSNESISFSSSEKQKSVDNEPKPETFYLSLSNVTMNGSRGAAIFVDGGVDVIAEEFIWDSNTESVDGISTSLDVVCHRSKVLVKSSFTASLMMLCDNLCSENAKLEPGAFRCHIKMPTQIRSNETQFSTRKYPHLPPLAFAGDNLFPFAPYMYVSLSNSRPAQPVIALSNTNSTSPSFPYSPSIHQSSFSRSKRIHSSQSNSFRGSSSFPSLFKEASSSILSAPPVSNLTVSMTHRKDPNSADHFILETPSLDLHPLSSAPPPRLFIFITTDGGHTWNPDATEIHIIAGNKTDGPDKPGSRLDIGMIALIAVGSVGVVSLSVALIIILIFKIQDERGKKPRRHHTRPFQQQSTEIDRDSSSNLFNNSSYFDYSSYVILSKT